ncbi:MULTISPECIES: cell division protein ZapD [unclassified Methylophaga]|jgi:cell division protein ZapD|uniref:cell division protein ZapD n=1 Tax=unclassified Methylophaga TaxID=2629249 RepID=UPI000C98DA6A|nr:MULTISPECIES: cell division protein ZapD [unclassified Methylophaga]MAK67339.1 cell division protein ZapD [Methylophaga sp.]MBN46607.1 cell division protein ZapD [Methylophaga sp.]|tara:strand:- start:5012 stop:5782 length:771 start_codon:yes stop_codon:yes gene_type:complete
MSDVITYEQPLNERIRTFLRLEFLLARVDYAMQHDDEMSHREAIDAMLNMLLVFERGDMKSEVTKEVERLITNLSALENSPGVDNETLDALLAELDQTLDALQIRKSAIGQVLKENEFLYSIRQRSSIAGGTCDFDLPAYHYWLQHSSVEQRQQQLNYWLEQFVAVRGAINISLKLIRGSSGFSTAQAEKGFYQRSLDSNLPTQLIRVRIPASTPYYPEISGGKHRFTVRFMTFDINQRPQQINDDADFQLSCCTM